MIIFEHVEIPDKPSPEFIQALRDIGASERTIRLAMGERPTGRRRLRLWFGI